MQNDHQKHHSKDKRNKNINYPPIPDKIYFTIGEVSNLCLIETYVIRFWENKFAQLKPAKRRCNKRYYQKEQILLIRKIKDLLYQEGFTIEGAKAKLAMSSINIEKKLEKLTYSNESQLNDVKTNTDISNTDEGANNLFSVKKIAHIQNKNLLQEIAEDVDEILSIIATLSNAQDSEIVT